MTDYMSRFQNSVSFGPALGKSGQKPAFSPKSKVAVPKSDILELPHMFQEFLTAAERRGIILPEIKKES
ncbi:MAG: hypothetical protein LBQ67_00115 [Treponema sp.]|jgi:hypothetical protein|nr:hypothetical protein [Treponema sp.]